MSTYGEKLKEYLITNRIQAEVINFNQPCRSVKGAAEAAGVPVTDVIKSICL